MRPNKHPNPILMCSRFHPLYLILIAIPLLFDIDHSILLHTPTYRSAHPAQLLPAPTAPPTAAHTLFHEGFTNTIYKGESDNTRWESATSAVTLQWQDNIDQQDVVLASGGGIIYAVWQDMRQDEGDIYAQRLDLQGNRLWATDRRLNSDDGAARQSMPAALADDAGQLIVVWSDERHGSSAIFGQQVDSRGDLLWVEDIQVSQAISTADQAAPTLAVSGAGQLLVAWHDSRTGDYDIYAQQLRQQDGARLWPADRRINSDASLAPQTYPAALADSAGNVTLAWLDQRIGNGDLYAQRLNPQGERLWSSELRINPADRSAQQGPTLAGSADGAFVAAWVDGDSGALYAQRIQPDQQHTWPLRQLNHSSTPADPNRSPILTQDSTGQTWVAWVSASGVTLFTQKLDQQGNRLWTNELPVNEPAGVTPCAFPALVALPTGDLLYAWLEQRQGEDGELVAQLLNNQGERQWPRTVPLNDALGQADQQTPVVAALPDGSTVVAWQDGRGDAPALYLQRVDNMGQLRWRNHIHVTSASTTTIAQLTPALATGGNEVVVAWSAARNGIAQILAQRLDPLGRQRWPRVSRVSRTTLNPVPQFHPALAANAQGITVVAWEETVNNSQRLALQQIQPDGTPVWASDLHLESSDSALHSPAVAMDEAGNTFVVWLAGDFAQTDLYAQKISLAGQPLWAAPVRVNRFAGLVDHFNPPAVTVDSSGQATVLWVDRRLSGVYAQRLDPNGAPLWAEDLLLNSTPGPALPRPAASATANGEAVVVWQGVSGGRFSIFAQRISSSGQQLWGDATMPDRVVTQLARQAQQPQVAVTAQGESLVVWQDERRMNPDVYAQRLDPQGVRLWADDQPVVADDRFYVGRGLIRSQVFDSTEQNIQQALLTAAIDYQQGDAEFWLSNDDGKNWAPVALGVLHTFTTTGSALRWQAVLHAHPDHLSASPILHDLWVEYRDGGAGMPSADAYEADDQCSAAWPLAVDGAPQVHTLHVGPDRSPDGDWLRLRVAQDQPYVLAVTTAQPADLRLQLHPTCSTPPLLQQQVSATTLARLAFTATASTELYLWVGTSTTTATLPISYQVSARTVVSPGLAILVGGALLAQDPYQPQVNQAANRVYRLLRSQGLTAAQIHYLSAQPEQDVDGNGQLDDIDGLLTYEQLVHALQQWPLEQSQGGDLRLWLYLVGRGESGRFFLDQQTVIDPATLARWLGNLEATADVAALTVLLDANGAGSWLAPDPDASDLVHPGRTIIGSTGASGVTWPTTQGMLFSDAFWWALASGLDVPQSFAMAHQGVQAAGYLCPQPGATCQQPWLVAGAGGGVGRYRANSLAGGVAFPRIQQVQVRRGATPVSATLEVQIANQTTPMMVEAHLLPPAYQAQAPAAGRLPTLDLPVVRLLPGEPVTPDGVVTYRGDYAGFTLPGEYRVVIYAWDATQWAAAPQARFHAARYTQFLPQVYKNAPP